MRKVHQHCTALKVYCQLTERPFYLDASIRQLEIALPGGGRIIGLPANPLTARGYTGDVFLDEFAMHREDEAIWSALFPTLLRGDGELDVASTPRGRKNTFYRIRANTAFQHSTLTLEDAIAQGLKADARAMREAVGDELAWRQEFCCEFADEATAFITHDLIRQCQDIGLSTRVDWSVLKRRDAEVYVGVDVGRWHDLTAAWLWERVGEDLITRGVMILRKMPFDEQEKRLACILEERSVRRCCIDGSGLGAHLAERIVTRFGEHRVERMTFTSALKTEMAGRVRVWAERGRLRIPADEDIVHDWHSIEQKVTAGGHVRFDADRSAGGHADRFWAAALGLHAASDPQGEVEFQTAGAPMFARDGVW